MLPIVITSTELRANIAKYLNMAEDNIVLIKGKKSNKVILDEKYYNYLSSLAKQFELEDPEGEYREEFVNSVLTTAKRADLNDTDLRDLL